MSVNASIEGLIINTHARRRDDSGNLIAAALWRTVALSSAPKSAFAHHCLCVVGKRSGCSA